MIKKFKTHFCARVDKQLQDIEFFETYAPVVQWLDFGQNDANLGDSDEFEAKTR